MIGSQSFRTRVKFQDRYRDLGLRSRLGFRTEFRVGILDSGLGVKF